MKKIIIVLSVTILIASIFVTGGRVNAEEDFKEPVLLWEREFDPPIAEISDQNGNGDFLAIQVKKEEESGRPIMQKLLVIDSKGKTKREELLSKKKKVTIPADQLWLTASDDEELKKLKNAKKPKTLDAWGREIYISGNGEYFATVLEHGNWYEFEYKDKNGKTLWKINPKDNYGFWKAYVSYDGSRIVIIDMGGLSGGDVWEVLGQRVYFYDNTGKLLKDYDFGEKEDAWLRDEKVVISLNSKYIAMTRGSAIKSLDKSIVLFDGNGDILWDKSFTRRHSIGRVTNEGNISFSEYDNVRLKYFAALNGNLITTVETDSHETIEFMQSGSKLYARRKKLEGEKEKDWLKAKDNFKKYSIDVIEIPLEKLKPQHIKDDFVSNIDLSPSGKYIMTKFADDTILPSKSFYNHAIIELYDKTLKKIWTKEHSAKKWEETVFPLFLGVSDILLLRDLNNIHISIYDLKGEGGK